MSTITIKYTGTPTFATEYALTLYRNLHGEDGEATITDAEVTVTPKE